jgi:DinB superfamily
MAVAPQLPLAFKTFRITRFHLMREVEGLSREQMLCIPEGRDDNILWNVGHLLCSLSRLTYVFSGYDLPIPEAYLGLFGKNTTTTAWETTPDLDEVMAYFISLPDKIEQDYTAGRFAEYKPLQIVPGDDIRSVEEAIAFHCFHEGLHIGKILTLKEAMGLPVKGG